MEVAGQGDIILPRSWNVLPFEGFEAEHIQVGCHATLCGETSALEICETKHCVAQRVTYKEIHLGADDGRGGALLGVRSV